MQALSELVELVGHSPEKLSEKFIPTKENKPEDVSLKNGYRYISYFQNGISFCISRNEGIVKSAYLYGLGKDLFEKYKGELPNDIRFGDTEEDIVQKLGVPSSQGKEDKNTKKESKYLRYRKGTVLAQADLIFYLYPNSGLLMVEVQSPSN